MKRTRPLGFDRRIDIEWLDAAADMVASGASETELRAYLWRLLDGIVAGENSHSGRGKTVTVLSHMWCQVPPYARPLRDRALRLLPEVPPEQRLSLHWAMMLGTYPFAADVSAGLGKLLALQGDVALSQITRRLVEGWGDRSTMLRATQRIVRSMVQWGVLADTEVRGIYTRAAGPRHVTDEIAQLLVEALLTDAAWLSGANEHVVAVDQLVGHPALFPFKLSIGAHQLRTADQFVVHRQGLDVDVVGLAVSPATPAPAVATARGTGNTAPESPH